jgi:hypothetical protein
MYRYIEDPKPCCARYGLPVLPEHSRCEMDIVRGYTYSLSQPPCMPDALIPARERGKFLKI